MNYEFVGVWTKLLLECLYFNVVEYPIGVIQILEEDTKLVLN